MHPQPFYCVRDGFPLVRGKTRRGPSRSSDSRLRRSPVPFPMARWALTGTLGAHSGGPVRVLHPIPYSPLRRSRRRALGPICNWQKKSITAAAFCQRDLGYAVFFALANLGTPLTGSPIGSKISEIDIWDSGARKVPSGSKGKQVRILRDPVTVRGERNAPGH